MSSITAMMSGESSDTDTELSSTATAGLIAGTGGVLSTAIGGMMERKAADKKAALIEEEGQVAYEAYIAEAARTRENANKYQANQTMKYVMSGVSISGTPMLALQYTSQQSRLEVEAIENRALRAKKLALANALATRQEAIYSSNYRLGQSISKAATSMYSSGMFDSSGSGLSQSGTNSTFNNNSGSSNFGNITPYVRQYVGS